MFSVINRYPTNALAAIENPITNIKKSAKVRFLYHRNTKHETKCTTFPNKATFCLPSESLSRGNNILPISTPVKNREPKCPNSDLGEHSIPNY
jgi:hypothetical protein